jgi:hypothetical protein
VAFGGHGRRLGVENNLLSVGDYCNPRTLPAVVLFSMQAMLL